MEKENKITYVSDIPLDIEEAVLLYHSVGWTHYSYPPDALKIALQNSTYVLCAYDHGQLIGLIRGLSDHIAIHFIQDILILPKYHRTGVGSTLIKKALAMYPNVHKHVLLTDDKAFQKLFYESLGFHKIESIDPKLNAYLIMDDC